MLITPTTIGRYVTLTRRSVRADNITQTYVAKTNNVALVRLQRVNIKSFADIIALNNRSAANHVSSVVAHLLSDDRKQSVAGLAAVAGPKIAAHYVSVGDEERS